MKAIKSTRREFLKQSGFALTAVSLVPSMEQFTKFNYMTDDINVDVIIIGGSYAGLSAAMTLGRSLRNVLLIDSGKPCNLQTPHSHNFITQDGNTPVKIATVARNQVLEYKTVKFIEGLVINVRKLEKEFEVLTASNDRFTTKKILFATGITDQMPNIKGFSECWGITVLHCPYCHGYEVRNQNIGLLGNGEAGFDLCKLISNWTEKLTLFTNGKCTLTESQLAITRKLNIDIIENNISEIKHVSGRIERVVFNDSEKVIDALFARVGFKQHCEIPMTLGCELTEQGHLKIDDFQRTSVKGIFAAGDNTTPFRSVSVAVSSGTKAGVFINKELIDEVFF